MRRESARGNGGEAVRIMYYDMQGEPISREEWAELLEDSSKRTIAQTKVGNCLVSTVWLGLDHSLHGGPPHIFETMVLDCNEDGIPSLYSGDGEKEARYSTRAEAEAGHARIVEQLKRKLG